MARERRDETHVDSDTERGSAYFGWWYFDFVTEDGLALNIVVHETDVFGISDDKYMSATVSMPDQDGGIKNVYFKKKLEVDFLQQDSSQLYIPGLVEEDNGGVSLNLDFDGLSIKGRLNKSLQTPNTHSRLNSNPEEGRNNYWKVIVPDGEFNGNVTVGEASLPVKARGYMDRNWGTEKMQGFVRDWVWGHFSDGTDSVVFYDLIDNSGRRISKFFIMNEAGVSEGVVGKSQLDQLVALQNLEGIELNEKNPMDGTEISIDIAPNNLMRSWLNKDFGSFWASYLRWHSQARIGIGGQSKILNGITEYMRIRTKESEERKDPDLIILFTGLSGSGKSTLAREVAKRLGYSPLDSREMYKPLAKRSGYESAREWLGLIGTHKFMDAVIDESIARIKDQKSVSGFTMDAAGKAMLARVQSEFPNSTIKLVSVNADDATRIKRIAARQNLTIEEAEMEKGFRDAFLIETGVEETMEAAELFIDNGSNADLAGNVERILRFLFGEQA